MDGLEEGAELAVEEKTEKNRNPVGIPQKIFFNVRNLFQRHTAETTETTETENQSEDFKTPTPQEEIIGTREKVKKATLSGNSNEVIFVSLKNDGGAIFKPSSGENPWLRPNVESGSYFRRERAAYLVSRILGFDLVPPTVIRTIDDETGSIQEFIPGAKHGYEVDLSGYSGQLYKLWLFDMIIWNSDRHGFNFLVKEDKLFAIDNSLSFARDSLKFYREYYGEEAPQTVLDLFRRILEDKTRISILKEFLGEVLEENEVRACMHRIMQVATEITTKNMMEKNVNFDPV